MNADELIESAKPEMRQMLRSVYSYNLQFIKTPDERKLLLRILEAMTVADRRFFVETNAVYVKNSEENRTLQCADEFLSIQKTYKPHTLVCGKTQSFFDVEAWNEALSIGEGQTISQPSTVARMLILSRLKKGNNVLEIGTGSGWNASLMAFLAYPGSITSAERIYSLLRNANKNIEALRKNLKKNKERFSRIKLVAKDIFSAGKPPGEKYDRIIFTAGISDSETGRDVLKIAKNLLGNGGILVCPYSAGPILVAKKHRNGGIEAMKTQEEYVFVPLIRGTA